MSDSIDAAIVGAISSLDGYEGGGDTGSGGDSGTDTSAVDNSGVGDGSEGGTPELGAEGSGTPSSEVATGTGHEGTGSGGDGEGDGGSNDGTERADGTDGADEFASEHGLSAKEPSGRENRIPYSRVKKISENAVAKARKSWEAEALAPERAKVTEYEGRLQAIAGVEHIMYNEQERFLDILREIPGYAKLLGGAKGQQGGAKGSTGQAVDPDGDIDWTKAPGADGADGYTPQGLTQLLQWTVKQAKDAAIAATEKRLGERYAPIENEFKSAAQARELEGKLNVQLNDMKQWPHFMDHKDEILKLLQEDTAQYEAARASGRQAKFQHTARSAWEKVVFGKLTTDRNKVRQEVIAEMKRAPRSTTAGAAAPQSGAAKGAAPAGMDPVEWAIRQSIQGAK